MARVSPWSPRQRSEILDLVIDRAHRAAEQCGIAIGIMVAANRDHGPVEATKTAELAAERAGLGVVSFGLDGDESAHPPEDFAAAFAIAREAGIRATPHAGELAGPASIWGALDSLRADRVLHGIRALEDPDLVERLVSRGTCLDVCPTSNVALSVVPSFEQHPLPRLISAGIRCSVNADDPLLFRSGLLDEYTLCRERLGLSDEEIATLAVNSLECASAPVELVEAGLLGVRRWLAR